MGQQWRIQQTNFRSVGIEGHRFASLCVGNQIKKSEKRSENLGKGKWKEKQKK